MTWDKITVFFLKLSWILYHVAAIQIQDLYPYGMFSGDVTLQEGDDETSRVITLTKPMYFYEASFRNLYVATNGIISTQDLPMEKQYVDDGFPTDFPVIAPFLADIDTSNGKGSIYYRQTESPTVLKQVEGDVKRGFPDATFTPTHAFIATWENVSAYEEVVRSSTPSNRVRAVFGMIPNVTLKVWRSLELPLDRGYQSWSSVVCPNLVSPSLFSCLKDVCTYNTISRIIYPRAFNFTCNSQEQWVG